LLLQPLFLRAGGSTNWIFIASPFSLSLELDKSKEEFSLFLNEAPAFWGMLQPAAFEFLESFVGASVSIAGRICVAIGAFCFNGVAVGERFGSYAQPRETLAHPCF
jgi:hypothetical protein